MFLEWATNWLNSPEGIAVTGAFGILGGSAVIFAIVRSIWHQIKGQGFALEEPEPALTQARVAPRTWWEYLTNDLELSPKERKACAALYEVGWQQLNHPSNNREESTQDYQAQLQELVNSIDAEELQLAEELGIRLTDEPAGDADELTSLLNNLSPAAQSYARIRSNIRQIEKDKAVDIALGTPLTDFREVKRALREGTPPAHILDQLPLAWRMIRTIRDPRPQSRRSGKALRPTKVRLTVETENGIQEDDRAELDEDWVISDRLDMILPYTGIIPIYRFEQEGKPPVLKDRRMVFEGWAPPGSEAKLWTRGGYGDRVLERASRGEDRRTLKRELFKRRLNFAAAVAGTILLLASILFRVLVEIN